MAVLPVSIANDKNVICPLTPKLMKSRLISIKKKLENGDTSISKSEDEHLIRMASEVLDNNEFSDLFKEIKSDKKTCSRFWIGVHVGSLKSTNARFSESSRTNALNEVNKCIEYIDRRYSNNNGKIQSYACE